jgi:hypothetical protein
MRTIYLRFCAYVVEIMAFQRNVPSTLSVTLCAESLYANLFFRSLSIAYNEDHIDHNIRTNLFDMHEAADERAVEVCSAGFHLQLDLATIRLQNIGLEVADQRGQAGPVQ